MADTQQQWYLKCVGWVPSWYFEKQKYAVAQFQAIAALFQSLQQDVDDHLTATFYTKDTTPIEDAYGAERQKTRLAGETDSTYALRIQQITSQTDKPDILAAINQLLLEGPAVIFETPFDNPYCARNTFCSRSNYLINARRNFFLVVVPRQTHPPYSFVGDIADAGTEKWANFCSRGTYAGSYDSTSVVLNSVVAKINSMKAFGVMYAILETS